MKRAGTLYSLRLLPIGGYVMLEGEDEAVDSPGSFSNKPVLTRISVLLAGAFNNLVLGYVILVILTAISGYVGTTTIVKFNDGAQSSAQLMLGDRVTRVNGHRVRTSNDITYEFLRDRDGLIDMTVVREGETLTLPVQFRMEQLEEGVQAIEIDFKVAAIPATPGQYLTYPVNWSLSIVKQVWGSFLDLLTGRYAVNQLSGPVGVVSAIGQATKLGFESFLLMAAFITINIGIFNLIPFPILDGGKGGAVAHRSGCGTANQPADHQRHYDGQRRTDDRPDALCDLERHLPLIRVAIAGRTGFPARPSTLLFRL